MQRGYDTVLAVSECSPEDDKLQVVSRLHVLLRGS